MDEYINREDVLKCLEYNTIQKPSANDVVSATLRVAREKVEKLPVAQEGVLLSFWRDPDKDPPKVETEVLILYRNEIDGYGITTAHYEDGSVFYKIAYGIGKIFPIGGHTTRSGTTTKFRKAGGNTATSTRTRFTTTGLTGLLLVGCLCHRRK